MAWDLFKEIFSDNTVVLSNLEKFNVFSTSDWIKFTTGDFVTESQLEEVENFFRTHPIEPLQKSICQSVEKLKINVEILKREEKNILNFFNDKKYQL